MKRNLGYIKLVLVVLLVAFLFGFAENRHKGRKIKEVGVQFTDSENLYVTEQAVNKLLIQNKALATSVDKEILDLNRVESVLNKHDMIENAEVYLTLDGKLRARVSQRKPIGRVMGNTSFYLDRNGKIMPLSPNYSARVPLMYGFNRENISGVYPLIEYIRNDEFLTRHITAVRRLSSGRYELELRKLDFDVYFGTTDNIAFKFNNFKAFYKKALKDDKLNTYRKVSLQFGNQVVCTKK